jgi:hypothetical protein
MCEPTTILAIGSMVVGQMGAARAAKAQDSATKQAYANDTAQTNEMYRQQSAQNSQEMSERSREALAEKGRLRAARGEGGVGGNSINRIVNQSDFNLGQDLSTMNTNQSNLTSQARMSGVGNQATAQSRMNAVKRPSFLDAGLQIGGVMAGDAKVKSYFN